MNTERLFYELSGQKQRDEKTAQTVQDALNRPFAKQEEARLEQRLKSLQAVSRALTELPLHISRAIYSGELNPLGFKLGRHNEAAEV